MEDVLEVYHRPFDPDRPVVCIDEASKQLIGEKGGKRGRIYFIERLLLGGHRPGSALHPNLFGIGSEVENFRRLNGKDANALVIYQEVLPQARVEIRRVKEGPVGLQLQPATLLDLQPPILLAVGIPELAKVALVENTKPGWLVEFHRRNANPTP